MASQHQSPIVERIKTPHYECGEWGFKSLSGNHVLVAKLAKATACKAVTRRFDPDRGLLGTASDRLLIGRMGVRVPPGPPSVVPQDAALVVKMADTPP
jgi:hypothetical protein